MDLVDVIVSYVAFDTDYYQPTIGYASALCICVVVVSNVCKCVVFVCSVNLQDTTVRVDESNEIRLRLWDPSGQERFRADTDSKA